jgi:hypothetical protein
MAVDVSNLAIIGQANGFAMYRYDTLDASADVDTSGYFNNADESVNLRVGDIIWVVDWTTAVRTGTIAAYGHHVVVSVSAAGVVDLGLVSAGSVTDTD